jgi:hypothetical protein
MTIRKPRTRTAALWVSAAMALSIPLALPGTAHANGQQCNPGPIPVLSNTNCQGDSGGHGGGSGSNSSSSSSSSSSGSSGANNGGQGGSGGAGGNSGRQG